MATAVSRMVAATPSASRERRHKCSTDPAAAPSTGPSAAARPPRPGSCVSPAEQDSGQAQGGRRPRATIARAQLAANRNRVDTLLQLRRILRTHLLRTSGLRMALPGTRDQQGATGSGLSTIRYTRLVDPKVVTAGAVLRQARKRAGLSQVELATRAGVTQSVISAYESEQRQPSIPALARLIEAAGYELTLGLRHQPNRLRRLSGPVGRRVRRHRHCMCAPAAAHGVRNLRVFGSVARGEDRPGSDVDLLADLPPGLSLFGLGRVEADLETILGTRVDLIPAADLKPGVSERVTNDLIAL